MISRDSLIFKTLSRLFFIVLVGWVVSVFVRFESSERSALISHHFDSVINSQAALAKRVDTPSNNPNIFVKLAKTVVFSVVNISTTAKVRAPYGRKGGAEDPFRDFWEKFFGMPGGPGWDEDGPMQPPQGGMQAPRAMSLGTGFIIEASGLIMTNNHVVAGADEIKIHFTEEADEKPTDGEVVGRDPELDLALIRVKSKRTLVPVVFGDSDTLEVGEYVIAVGNPFGQGHSVTHGIISAKNRDSPDFVFAKYLQTDAPINPGNSGGPLVNLKGEVIGINNAIDARAQGIGFAIPSNLVKSVLSQLKTKGSVSRGYIGVNATDLSPEISKQLGLTSDQRGAFVSNVYSGAPADQAGIKPYDVIIGFGKDKIGSSADLVRSVTSIQVGQEVPVKVFRDAKEKALTIRLAERPSSAPPRSSPIKKEKKKSRAGSAIAGLSVETLNPELAKEYGLPANTKGVIVDDLTYEGPAAQAGMRRGDVIAEIDRKSVKTSDEVDALLTPKKSHLIRVRRSDAQEDGEDRYLVIVLDLRDAKSQ